MELPSSPWLSDLGMDDSCFIHQCELSSLDEFTSHHMASALDQNSLSSESYTSNYPAFAPPKSSAAADTFVCPPVAVVERPAKHPKTGTWSSRKVGQVSAAVPGDSFPRILSFGRQDEAADDPRRLLRGFNGAVLPVKPEGEVASMAAQGAKRAPKTGARPPSHAQDHIIAERKRREKISQRFIALSAIVPGLKKTDKASVLGDAIKYVKQLEERVKALEKRAATTTVESVVLVKKSQVPADDGASSSSGENSEGAAPSGAGQLPEVEVRISDRSVLARVHCEGRRGVLVKLLGVVEMLHLTVVNTSVMPFAGSALDITVMAQMEEEFSVTVKDLVRHLNSACRDLM